MADLENLKPFKFWSMTNFPFISDDFDQMTYYEILCKIVEYLDKQIIPLCNNQNENIIALSNQVANLQTWFDNLDVTEEVNAKLDEMAESGELEDIIAQYLNLAGIFGFDKVSDMKAGTNYIVGSICRTLGKDSYLDGKGSFYRVRQLTSGDVIDEINIIALTNFPTLIAEKIGDYEIDQIKSTLTTLDSRIDTLENISNIKFLNNLNNEVVQNLVCAGDSLTWGEDGNNSGSQLQSLNYPFLLNQFFEEWYGLYKVNVINKGSRGQKSAEAVTNFNTFLAENPNAIIWQYGTNDLNNNISIEQIIKNLNDFYNLCATNNIELFVMGMPTNFKDSEYRRKSHESLNKMLKVYCQKNGIVFFDLFEHLENIYKSMNYNYTDLQPDGTHFSTYKPFSDIVIGTLLNACFIGENACDFIEVGKNYGYSKTNGGLATGQDIFFNKSIINFINTQNPYFYMNIFCKTNSILEIIYQAKNTGGIGKFSVNGTNYNVNSYNSGYTTNEGENQETFTFPILLDVGLNRVRMTDIEASSGGTNFYIIGFNLKQVPYNKVDILSKQRKKRLEAWSGNSTSLTNQALNSGFDFGNYNEGKILIGSGSNMNIFTINSANCYTNFNKSAGGTQKFIVTDTSGNISVSTLKINSDGTFNYSGSVALRSIILYKNYYDFKLLAENLDDITKGILNV